MPCGNLFSTDPGFLDDLVPLLHVSSDGIHEFLTRAANWLRSDIEQFLLEIGSAQLGTFLDEKHDLQYQ